MIVEFELTSLGYINDFFGLEIWNIYVSKKYAQRSFENFR